MSFDINNDKKQNQSEDQTDLEKQLEDVQQPESDSEEQLMEKGRIALVQIETEGKKYFKPRDGVKYRLEFDRATSLNVRGQPSNKLTRKISDRNDPKKIVGEVPVMEWVYQIKHISGNEQTWSITSKRLAAKILNELINGKSVIEFMKAKTGTKDTDVEYSVVGVS
jgi:hypothetical protein